MDTFWKNTLCVCVPLSLSMSLSVSLLLYPLSPKWLFVESIFLLYCHSVVIFINSLVENNCLCLCCILFLFAGRKCIQ